MKLIQTAILKCTSDDGAQSDYRHLIYLVKICAENCKQLLLNTFEMQLDNKFNSNLYEALIGKADYDWKLKDYFQAYTDQVNRIKGKSGAIIYGEQGLTDGVFIRYAYLVYKLDIDFRSKEVKSLTNLNDFETWLLNPIEFDYEKFDAKWLVEIDSPIYLNRIKSNNKIKTAIDQELENSFEPTLAKIRYTYFSGRE